MILVGFLNSLYMTFFIWCGLHRYFCERYRKIDSKAFGYTNLVVPKRTLTEAINIINRTSNRWMKDKSLGAIPTAQRFEYFLSGHFWPRQDFDCDDYSVWCCETLSGLDTSLLLIRWNNFNDKTFEIKGHYLCYFILKEKHFAISNWGLTGPCENKKDLLKKLIGNKNLVLAKTVNPATLKGWKNFI